MHIYHCPMVVIFICQFNLNQFSVCDTTCDPCEFLCCTENTDWNFKFCSHFQSLRSPLESPRWIKLVFVTGVFKWLSLSHLVSLTGNVALKRTFGEPWPGNANIACAFVLWWFDSGDEQRFDSNVWMVYSIQHMDKLWYNYN